MDGNLADEPIARIDNHLRHVARQAILGIDRHSEARLKWTPLRAEALARQARQIQHTAHMRQASRNFLRRVAHLSIGNFAA